MQIGLCQQRWNEQGQHRVWKSRVGAGRRALFTHRSVCSRLWFTWSNALSSIFVSDSKYPHLFIDPLDVVMAKGRRRIRSQAWLSCRIRVFGMCMVSLWELYWNTLAKAHTWQIKCRDSDILLHFDLQGWYIARLNPIELLRWAYACQFESLSFRRLFFCVVEQYIFSKQKVLSRVSNTLRISDRQAFHQCLNMPKRGIKSSKLASWSLRRWSVIRQTKWRV